MCPYCYSHCPFLLSRRAAQSPCLGKQDLYAMVRQSQPSEIYYISFNSSYAEDNNGHYHIQSVSGDSSNFIVTATNFRNEELKFTSDQICSMHFEAAPKSGQEEINQFVEQTFCWYDGKQYTPGAKISVGGKTITCIGNGQWV